MVGVGLAGRLMLWGCASARRLVLSSSVSQVARWSPRFSTTPPTSLISAAATSEAALQKLRSANSSGVPFLLLPPQRYEHGRQGCGLDGDHDGVVTASHFMGLLDIESGTSVPVAVPVPQNAAAELLKWQWIGSSQGWLILGDLDTNLLCLFNPFDNSRIIRISLPDTYPRELPTHVLLTSPPPSSSSSSVAAKCQVFALYYRCIAICSLSADSNSSPPWKLLTTTKNASLHCDWYADVVLDGRWLITLSWDTHSDEKWEEVYVEYWDLDGCSGPEIYFNDGCRLEQVFVKSQQVLSLEKSAWLHRRMYMLRWSPPGQPLERTKEDDSRDMLLVIRFVAPHAAKDGTLISEHDTPREVLDENPHKTVAFDVYRNRSDGASMQWERVESLGDRAIFLDCNQSWAIPVAAGGGSAIKSNCIYFADDSQRYSFHSRHDCGFFDMTDRTIQSLNKYDLYDYGSNAYSGPDARPVWLLPTSQP